jgi:putative tricarboxylic transport membrane protein
MFLKPKETLHMRRDDLPEILAALAAAGACRCRPVPRQNVKMMIPANPGGGWDTTGRALGKALIDAKAADSVTYDNKGGAAGALGLAQFVNGSKGDPNALMVMGAVMLGGIITGKPPVNLSQATPIARLTSEYNVFVLPANSPLKTMADVVAQLKKDPGSVKWGGGSRGSTEHIAAAMIAQKSASTRPRSTTSPSGAAARPPRPSWAATSRSAAAATASSPNTSRPARCAPSPSPRRSA